VRFAGYHLDAEIGRHPHAPNRLDFSTPKAGVKTGSREAAVEALPDAASSKTISWPHVPARQMFSTD
jgi:hypothetical protein